MTLSWRQKRHERSDDDELWENAQWGSKKPCTTKTLDPDTRGTTTVYSPARVLANVSNTIGNARPTKTNRHEQHVHTNPYKYARPNSAAHMYTCVSENENRSDHTISPFEKQPPKLPTQIRLPQKNMSPMDTSPIHRACSYSNNSFPRAFESTASQTNVSLIRLSQKAERLNHSPKVRQTDLHNNEHKKDFVGQKLPARPEIVSPSVARQSDPSIKEFHSSIGQTASPGIGTSSTAANSAVGTLKDNYKGLDTSPSMCRNSAPANVKTEMCTAILTNDNNRGSNATVFISTRSVPAISTVQNVPTLIPLKNYNRATGGNCTRTSYTSTRATGAILENMPTKSCTLIPTYVDGENRYDDSYNSISPQDKNMNSHQLTYKGSAFKPKALILGSRPRTSTNTLKRRSLSTDSSDASNENFCDENPIMTVEHVTSLPSTSNSQQIGSATTIVNTTGENENLLSVNTGTFSSKSSQRFGTTGNVQLTRNVFKSKERSIPHSKSTYSAPGRYIASPVIPLDICDDAQLSPVLDLAGVCGSINVDMQDSGVGTRERVDELNINENLSDEIECHVDDSYLGKMSTSDIYPTTPEPWGTHILAPTLVSTPRTGFRSHGNVSQTGECWMPRSVEERESGNEKCTAKKCASTTGVACSNTPLMAPDLLRHEPTIVSPLHKSVASNPPSEYMSTYSLNATRKETRTPRISRTTELENTSAVVNTSKSTLPSTSTNRHSLRTTNTKKLLGGREVSSTTTVVASARPVFNPRNLTAKRPAMISNDKPGFSSLNTQSRGNLRELAAAATEQSQLLKNAHSHAQIRMHSRVPFKKGGLAEQLRMALGQQQSQLSMWRSLSQDKRSLDTHQGGTFFTGQRTSICYSLPQSMYCEVTNTYVQTSPIAMFLSTESTTMHRIFFKD
eukprot:CFRG2815T1